MQLITKTCFIGMISVFICTSGPWAFAKTTTCNDAPFAKLPALVDKVTGLRTCLSSSNGLSFDNLKSLVRETKPCPNSILDTLKKVPLIDVVLNHLPALIDRVKKEKITAIPDIEAFFGNMTNNHFGDMCFVVRKQLMTCLDALLPKLGPYFQRECCQEVVATVNKVKLLGLPKYMKGDWVLFFKTLLYQLDALVCSQRNGARDQEYCGYNLVHNTFADFSKALVNLPSLLSVTKEAQCNAFNGLEFVDRFGYTSQMWDFGECATQVEELLYTFRQIPALHYVFGKELPISNMTVKDVVTLFEGAPCCQFDTKVIVSKNVFHLPDREPSCDRSPPTLPFPLSLFGSAGKCIGSDEGLSLNGIIELLASCSECKLDLVEAVKENLFVKKASTKLSEVQGRKDKTRDEKMLTFFVWLAVNIKTEDYDALCSLMNQRIFTCLDQLLTKIFLRLEEPTCSGFKSTLGYLSLLIVPEGFKGGLEGLLRTMLGSMNELICSVRQDPQASKKEYCLSNIIRNIVTSWNGIFKVKNAPKAEQCQALNGQLPGVWNIGECSTVISNLFELADRIPIVQVFRSISIDKSNTVGDVLKSWSEAPCCEFTVKITRPTSVLHGPFPPAACLDKPLVCTNAFVGIDSTVVPYANELKSLSGISKCLGSSHYMKKLLYEMGSPQCYAMMAKDILGGQDPFLKATQSKLADVFKERDNNGTETETDDGPDQVSHSEALLRGASEIMKSMRTIQNEDVGMLCSFLDKSMKGCLMPVVDAFYKLMNHSCCKGLKGVLDQFYQFLRKDGSNFAYENVGQFLKGVFNNLNAAVCTKHSKDFAQGQPATEYCGKTLMRNTLGFNFTILSPDLDPLSAAAIYTVFPLYRMLTAPPGQECNMLQQREYITDTKQCSTWNGLWFKYGCCGHPLGSFFSTLGQLPLVHTSLDELHWDASHLGLGNFLSKNTSFRDILKGFPGIGCCKNQLGECSFTADNAYGVKLPQMPSCPKLDKPKCKGHQEL